MLHNHKNLEIHAKYYLLLKFFDSESLLLSFNVAKWKRSLEMQVFEREMRLHDACGFDSGPQHILLSGYIGGLRYSVQIIQVAVGI